MELKETFALITGIIMMTIIVIATLVITGGLTKISVAECTHAEYAASAANLGTVCGFDSIAKQQLKCDKTSDGEYDNCLDNNKGLCCPTKTNNATIFNGICCLKQIL